MEVYIPTSPAYVFERGFGPWSRRGHHFGRVTTPMDFFGHRHRGHGGFDHPFSRVGMDHHPFARRGGCGGRRGLRSMMPERVRIEFDNMSLDDWVPPADVIGAIFARPGEPQQKDSTLAASANANATAAVPSTSTAVPNSNKNVFEVKLNVTDYNPETLKVTVANGFITVEANHEETKTEKDEQDNEVISEEFVSMHFKRSFAIPPNAIEDKLECKMTADGHLILSAPLKCIEPAPKQPAVRSIPINVAPPAAAVENQPAITTPEVNNAAVELESASKESEAAPNDKTN